MKRLLLTLTALLLTFNSFSQVPTNDLIENAIEIDPSGYNEENLRLDLATASGVDAAGCATGIYQKIFYKFTANNDGVVNAVLTDMISDPITQGFVIFYTAPNLNQTDESQLNVASACQFGETATVTVTNGQSYYVEVHRIDADTLSRITFTFAAPPPNDLIENAIEVTEANFYDENLRLDLATTNGIDPNGCGTGAFAKVYYKFTATTNGTAQFFLFPQNGGAITGNAFVIIFTAPDLNVTSEADLTLISNCAFETQPLINMVSGQSYYVLVYRDAPGELSKVQATIAQEASPEERQALIDLYNATDGPNWLFNTNWNTSAPVSTWANVTVEDGHVTSLVIATFGATGTLPSSLTDLAFLETADFRSNNLYGEVPDLSSISSLETYDVNQNYFSVEDLETHFANNSTITDFRYSSQTSLDPIINFEPTLGSNYTLEVTPIAGSNVAYQWYKDRATQPDIIVNGATNATHELTNIQASDLDNYICEISSTSIPDLIIRRLPIHLTGPVSQQERDALIAFYNALDGDNWTNNINWLSTEPVGTWSFIKTRGNKVIEINIFGDAGLNGELPTEIGDLIHLEMLSIGIEQGLTGELPSSVGNLSELQRLRLQLTGNTGPIPASVGNLSNLWELRIIATGMTGDLPPSLGNLSSLIDMTLFGERTFAGNGQSFTGTIPASFSNLTSLFTLDIRGNNMEGQIPNSLSNLTNLARIYLNDNDLVGPLPDFSGNINPTPQITLENNFFDFSDLVPLVNNGVPYSFISYSPQRTLDQEEEIMSLPGADIVLDLNDATIDRDGEDTASNNQFQWYKDNVAISGAVASTYTIVNAQIPDSGVYYCEITNTTLPDLVIVRANITVIIDDELSSTDFEVDNFSIYPNPANEWISIKTKSGSEATAQVYDVNGKFLFKKELTTELTAIAIDQLSAGVYLISVSSNTMQSTKRFIKQ
ncbi:T9SS type A sorting domain-containing protein [Psychroserpens sp.]|uniref:T9SS type A sorting domain-containing protein n=1 Tax=Psychroserpens sp. TaxID=2020870 RepID=UPI002B26FEF9|nr:T9SS type A sorting domain-containing protein [Psychroserpens sp.]